MMRPGWNRRYRRVRRIDPRGIGRAIPWLVVAVILVAGAWEGIELSGTGAAAEVANDAALAADLQGRASVVDGDTIEIHGERIRILDIDAPESRQTCTRPDGEQWRCGREAALALSDWIGQRTVTCDASGKDRYGRWLARCTVGGMDVAKWLAREGLAVPYRDCKCEVVRAAADLAKHQQTGIWGGDYQMPWDWRREH